VTHKQIIEDQIALVHQSVSTVLVRAAEDASTLARADPSCPPKKHAHIQIGMTTGGQAPPLQVFLAPSNISGDPYTKPATGIVIYDITSGAIYVTSGASGLTLLIPQDSALARVLAHTRITL
jgi:hypothetical protein